MQHPLACTLTHIQRIERDTDTQRYRESAKANTCSLTTLDIWEHMLYWKASLPLLTTVKLITPVGQSSTRLQQHCKDPLSPSPSIPHSLHQHLVDICAVPAFSICHGGQKTNDHVSAVARLYVWCHTGVHGGCGEGPRQEEGQGRLEIGWVCRAASTHRSGQ